MSSALTDIVVRALILYFLYSGARKGFLRALADPVALILGALVALVYYVITKNLVIAILIATFGPFVLNLCFSSALKVWHITILQNKPPSFPSRIGGAALCLLWRGMHLAILLHFIALAPIPPNMEWFVGVQNNVKHSSSYRLVARWGADNLSSSSLSLEKLTTLIQDPKKLRILLKMPEFQAIIQDERFQSLFADPRVYESIKNKRLNELLADPRLKDIVQDPKFLKKFLALQKKILESNFLNNEEPATGSP